MTAADIVDFSPFDPAFRADPHPWYPRLLHSSPGRIIVDGVPSLFVARAEHITAVVRDVARFSNAKPALPGMEKVDFFNGMPVMPYIDPPVHTKLRRMAAPAFMPKAMKAFQEPALARLQALIDVAGGAGRIDFVRDLADHVGKELILDLLLDVPRADWPVLLDITAAQGDLARTPPGGEKPASFQIAWDRGLAYCLEVIAAHRRNPSDGLISTMVNQGADPLSADELLAMLLLLFTAGLNTITTHLSCGLLLLLRHPEQMERLRADPGLARGATEEMLRYDAPNTALWRFAALDTDVLGVPVRATTPIYLMYGAANFDEEKYEDPYRFDITRPPKMHASFGEGIHFCLGAPIARLASNYLFPELVRRFPEMAVDEGFRPSFEGTPTVRRIASIPLSLRA